MQVRHGVRLLIANRIVIGRYGLLRIVDASVALCHLQGTLSPQLSFLGRCLRICLPILCCRIVVFTQSVELVTLLHSRVGSTSHEEYGDHTYCYQVLYLPHNVYNNEQASNKRLACPAIIPPGLVLFRPLD